MSGQDPESIILASESLHGGPLAHVPYSNGLVFTDRQDQLVFGMKEGGRDTANWKCALCQRTIRWSITAETPTC